MTTLLSDIRCGISTTLPTTHHPARADVGAVPASFAPIRIYPPLLATSLEKRYIVHSTLHRGLAMSALLNPPLSTDASPAAFAEAMARAEHDKERVLVTRDGHPVAALVPIEDVEALEAIEDAYDSRLAAEAMAQWEAEGRPKGTSLEELAERWGITLGSETE